MPIEWTPYNYQKFTFDHIINNPFCGVFLDMGLGKTVITLTAIRRFIYEDAEVEKVLVVAPKLVTKTVWKQEAAKWNHTSKMKVSIVWGNEKQRYAALKEKADVYVINRENLMWLVCLFQSKWPFRVVVLDELSSYKNHKSQRFEAVKMVRPYIKRLIGLTGTPAPNSLIDLWAPMFLLDQGERLGKTIGGYRERYFAPEKMDGYSVRSYRIRRDAENAIYSKIQDICISMKANDYIDLPPVIENDIDLYLSESEQAAYNEFEEINVLQLQDEEITAVNAAALVTKLLQFANGAIYNENKEWRELHDVKLDALDELIDESFGHNVIVFYTFKHDLERIKQRYPHARTLKSLKDVDDWNAGRIPLLVLHPASAGHGLNLQDGGHIMIWFGQNYSLELFEQAKARLIRQGQKHSVIIHRLVMRDTMDEDVIKALRRKARGQEALMEAVKARIDKYVNKVRL